MKVLQVNVRLQEGGAARIVLDLHRQLLNVGIESQFAYGWGEKGGTSSAEVNVPHSFQVGQQLQVASNMVLHRVVGIDCVPPGGEGRGRLIQAIQWADVVHLHVIHSYFLPFTWLVKELIRAGKSVVWTAHDYWMLTGRCASIEGCERWRDGCGSCPTQKNYPYAYFDFSAAQFKVKRRLLATLGPQLHVVTPSEFVASAIRDGLPDVRVTVIPNWIDTEFEAALRDVPLNSAPISFTAKTIKVVILSNDISDPTKVDRVLVNHLLEMPYIEVHTIGQNSPFTGTRVVNHGRITQRKRMVETIALADVVLFTSEKDTFGLIMIEALACGVPILAIDSLAAREVLSVLGIQPIENKGKIIEHLQNATLPNCYTGVTRAMLCENVLRNYCGSVAVMKYVSVYESAVFPCY